MKKTTKNAKNTAAKNAAAPKAEERKPADPASETTGKPTLTERRQQLRRDLSALSTELKEQHPGESVNRLLLAHYAEKLGCQVFDTWTGWKNKGRAVKRGQHAVTVWKPATDGGKARWLMEFLFAESQTYERRDTDVATA